MTVLEIIQRSSDYLARKGVESPRLQIELMLGHVLQVPRLKLYLNFERSLTEAELNTLREMVQRRALREPLQHILGSSSFCGLELIVNRDVLVPRSETELLAERAWTFMLQRASVNQARPSALDFGTGSGCLAIAVAVKAPQAEVHAVDISEAALEVARKNARRHEISERVHFHEGDGFAALPQGLRFDLLVSNPPYIPSQEIASLQPEVREHDPRTALDGGGDGLQYYRRLAAEAPAWLARAGRIMLEFGDGQEEAIRRIFLDAQWAIEAVEKDYSGHPRILTAHPAQPSGS